MRADASRSVPTGRRPYRKRLLDDRRLRVVRAMAVVAATAMIIAARAIAHAVVVVLGALPPVSGSSSSVVVGWSVGVSTTPTLATATVAGSCPTAPHATRPVVDWRMELVRIAKLPSDGLRLTTTTFEMSARKMSGSGMHASRGSSRV